MLAPMPFRDMGLFDLGSKAPPLLTESIQHAVFKYFIPPMAFYALLGGIMKLTSRKKESPEASAEAGGES